MQNVNRSQQWETAKTVIAATAETTLQRLNILEWSHSNCKTIMSNIFKEETHRLRDSSWKQESNQNDEIIKMN